MKKLTLFFSFFSLLLQACNSDKELTRDEALRQIKQERNFPVVIDYDISIAVTPNMEGKYLMQGLKRQV